MGLTERNQEASVCTNGKQVATLRKKKGLTQKQLAKIAGYSERLIRKAESDGSLSHTTVRDLAAALSHNGVTIQPADLVCSPESLAREFLAALVEYEAEMVARVEHFVDPQCVLFCAGDPEQIPFAGHWEGVDGLDSWVHAFIAMPVPPLLPDSQSPSFLSDGNSVVVWQDEAGRADELSAGASTATSAATSAGASWYTLRFEFRQRKLVRFELLFDTASMTRHLAKRNSVFA